PTRHVPACRGMPAPLPLPAGPWPELHPQRPTPATVVARLAADRPTLLFATPSFYGALLSSDVPAAAFATVRMAVSAGEPLPAQVFSRFRDRFGVELVDGVGSTEALHLLLSNRPGGIRPGRA